MKKQIKDEEIEKIKKQLPRAGAYQVISGMVNGAYRPRTIAAMLNQDRTMNTGVLQEAKRLIEIINQGKTKPNENNE
jgi:hypothetical protein